jgi:hypothetical protein
MKIRWSGGPNIPPEKTASNIANCKAHGFPEIGDAVRPALAIIGGGPSVQEHVRELQDWPGDVWASGSAFPWAVANGIKASYLTIGQEPVLAEKCAGASHAVLATCCDPSVFEALKGARVEVFDLHHEGKDANHGVSSVTAVPKVALLMGYTEIHFFGCDSSYEDQTHAYPDDPPPQFKLVVQCNGKSHKTCAYMLIQAEFLSVVMREVPSVFVNRSGGLLKALIEAPGLMDYDITHGDSELVERLAA